MATRMREKTAKRHENADRRPHAVARYVRVAPRKVRAVVNLIRGKSVKEAEAILMLTPRGATEPVMKVLKSASANAQNNLEMNPDDKNNYENVRILAETAQKNLFKKLQFLLKIQNGVL